MKAFGSSLARKARDAWCGRLPLWLTYWVLGVFGNMSFVAVLAFVYLAGGAGMAGVLWVVYVLSLLWFVFIFGAIWRAAAVYAGRRLWPVLARLGVLVGVLRMAAEGLWLSTLS